MDNELGEYVVHERVTLDVMTTAETAVSGSFPSAWALTVTMATSPKETAAGKVAGSSPSSDDLGSLPFACPAHTAIRRGTTRDKETLSRTVHHASLPTPRSGLGTMRRATHVATLRGQQRSTGHS